MEIETITITDEQYADWDGSPEELAGITGRMELAHVLLGDEVTHVSDGWEITIVQRDQFDPRDVAILGGDPSL